MDFLQSRESSVINFPNSDRQALVKHAQDKILGLGRITYDQDANFVYVGLHQSTVDDIHALAKSMIPQIERPPFFGKGKAGWHISVKPRFAKMKPLSKDLSGIEGREVFFTVEKLIIVEPEHWKAVSMVAILTLKSSDITKIQNEFGIIAEHEPHITIGTFSKKYQFKEESLEEENAYLRRLNTLLINHISETHVNLDCSSTGEESLQLKIYHQQIEFLKILRKDANKHQSTFLKALNCFKEFLQQNSSDRPLRKSIKARYSFEQSHSILKEEENMIIDLIITKILSLCKDCGKAECTFKSGIERLFKTATDGHSLALDLILDTMPDDISFSFFD